MQPDWRVQVTHSVVDAVIVVTVLVLVGLRILDAAIGIAIAGPLLGARASTLRTSSSSATAPVGGGAIALLAVVGSGFALLRHVGHVAMLSIALLLGVLLASCTKTDRAGAISIAGNECVVIQDPAGRALCVALDDLALFLNQIAARKAQTGDTAIAKATTTTTAASARATTAASSAP